VPDTIHLPVDGGNTRSRVLAAAREEILAEGILGLRVADVASRAHYSVSVIYRYFGDRNGLVAAVLGDLYEETLAARRQKIVERIPASGPLSIEHLVDLVPTPSEVAGSDELRMRLQILAVAATNNALEERISEIAQRNFAEMLDYVRHLRSRLPAGQPFDERVFTVMIVNQLLYYNSLLGPFSITDEDYRSFVRDKLACETPGKVL